MASLGITDEDIKKYGQSLLPTLMAAQSTLTDSSSTEDGGDVPLRPVPTKVLAAGMCACARVHGLQNCTAAMVNLPADEQYLGSRVRKVIRNDHRQARSCRHTATLAMLRDVRTGSTATPSVSSSTAQGDDATAQQGRPLKFTADARVQMKQLLDDYNRLTDELTLSVRGSNAAVVQT